VKGQILTRREGNSNGVVREVGQSPSVGANPQESLQVPQINGEKRTWVTTGKCSAWRPDEYGGGGHTAVPHTQHPQNNPTRHTPTQKQIPTICAVFLTRYGSPATTVKRYTGGASPIDKPVPPRHFVDPPPRGCLTSGG